MRQPKIYNKIFLYPDERSIDGLSCFWAEKPYVTGSIEYTRSDAFIEKAAKWLSEIENGTTIADIDKFVEDFKKAMKL